MNIDIDAVDNLVIEFLAARLPELYAGTELEHNPALHFAHFRERCEMFLHYWEHGLPTLEQLDREIALRTSFAPLEG